MRYTTLCRALFVLSCLSTSFCSAADLHVPADYATVQAAIDASVDGDCVVVHPGVYAEAIDFDGKAITVRSVDPDDRSVVESTVLDASDLGSSVVTFDSNEGEDSLLWGVTVTGGLAQYGGGIRCASSAPTIRQCVVIGNAATDYGGGIYGLFASPMVDRCRLIANSAERGGGYYAFNGALTMLQSEVVWNSATLGGGGAEMYSVDLAMTNCTFAENESEESFHSLNILGSPSGFVHNSIFHGMSGDHVGSGSDVPTFAHCIVRDGHFGEYIFDVAPVYVDVNGPDNVAGTVDDDFRLNRFSPGTDAGWNTAPGLDAVMEDMAGQPRFVDDGTIDDDGVGKGMLVDLGAHERQSDSALRVLTISPRDGLQNSVDESVDGDVLVLSPGVYNEQVHFRSKSICLRGTDPSDPATVAATIIDGSGHPGSVVYCFDILEGMIEGLTIRGGSQTKTGGGLDVQYCNFTVRACVFCDNHAEFGGGMFVRAYDRGISVSHCVFEDNSASFSGGGAQFDGIGDGIVTECVFRWNTGGSGGGIAGYYDLGPVLSHCTIHNNTAGSGGGASGCTLIDCEIFQNHATSNGGGKTRGTVLNCVVRNNSCGL